MLASRCKAFYYDGLRRQGTPSLIRLSLSAGARNTRSDLPSAVSGGKKHPLWFAFRWQRWQETPALIRLPLAAVARSTRSALPSAVCCGKKHPLWSASAVCGGKKHPLWSAFHDVLDAWQKKYSKRMLWSETFVINRCMSYLHKWWIYTWCRWPERSTSCRHLLYSKFSVIVSIRIYIFLHKTGLKILN